MPLVYRELSADEVVKTAELLHRRIEERFPECGLGKVAKEVEAVARAGRARGESISRRNWPLRGLAVLATILTVLLLYWTVRTLGFKGFRGTQDFVNFFESAMGALVFIGAALFFISGLEDRLKRRRALKALHELRSLAHIVDMHQLTKDPERALISGPDTASSPRRTLSIFELSRYLDYCVEMLALISKIGAIYAQGFADPVSVSAVDSLESMTNGLARKIWQKMIVLTHHHDDEAERISPPPLRTKRDP
jgi:hypothetical protein